MLPSAKTWLLFLFSSCLLSVQVGKAQDTGAPDGAETTLEQRLADAVEARDTDRLSALVRSNRLAIKPVVNGLIENGIRAGIRGDREYAEHRIEIARDVALAFEEVFGESSLTTAVSYVARWSADERRKKLVADSLYTAGTELRGSGDTREQAQADYERALEIYRSIGDRIGEASTIGGLGYIAYFNDRDRYLEINERALALRREVDDRELIGNSLNDVALAYRLVRDEETALEYYLESESVRIEIGDSLALARVLPNIGRTYSLFGRLETALEYYKRAATVAEAVGDGVRQAVALRNAGAVSGDLSRLADALSYFRQALDVRRANGEETIDILNHLGITYRRLGDFESALTYYQEVVEAATASGNGEELANALSNIGVVYVYAERPDRSLRYFERAREQFLAIEDPEGVLNATINLGSGNFELRDYEAAHAYTEEALQLARNLDDSIGETTALVLLGNILNRTGDYEASIANLERARLNALELNIPDLVFSATLGLGEVSERNGDYEGAVRNYEDAFAILEGTRGKLETDEDKAGFLAQQRYAYEEYIHMLSRLHRQQPDAGYDERSFLFAERAKARAFLDLLAEALADVQSGVDPTLEQERDSLLTGIALLRNQVALAAAAPDAAAAVGGAEELKARLATTEDEYARVQRRIREENPRFADLQYPEPLTLADVQSTILDDDVALLEYSIGDSSSTLWVVTSDDRRLITLPTRDVIRGQVELLRFGLTDPAATDASQLAGAARRLYEILIEPAAELVSTRENLIVVPDDALHYLPFEVLLTGDVPDGAGFDALPYLVQTHGVSYAQSASVLGQLVANREDRAAVPSKGLLAFGDPVFASEVEQGSAMRTAAPALARLPYSGSEVESISAYFEPGDADVFLRSSATEEKIKSAAAMGHYRYLHLATHGLVDERRPDFSAVVLAFDDDPTEDGLLQAAEIFNLNLNADLVVLSACETGLGQMVRGEGLVGLTRAFMYAGARSVVVSLWAVADESTSKLMDRLYGNLVQELAGSGTRTKRANDKTGALRAAKVEMIATGDYAHPFYWAPFVLSGDWR